MQDKVAVLTSAGVLICPDEGGPLQYNGDNLGCTVCGRKFPIFAGEVVELLPLKPTFIQELSNQKYTQGYLAEFNQPFVLIKDALAWGAPESVPSGWVQKRRAHVNWALPLIRDNVKEDMILCDVSAGAGYYTLEYSRYFKICLHCDLSVGGLNYAYFKTRALDIKNIIFVRADYLNPPFRRSIHRIICFDSLSRGWPHEELLLQALMKSLAPGGVALVDFHNWWHNPLRHIGLLPKISDHSYTRRRAQCLLAKVGIGKYEFHPWHQEFEPHSIADKIFSRIVSPTRLVYRFSTNE